ncbi:WD40-repeat-containing domain protein [Nemania sp. FL0916]|nr:WD40-repeat-containing domain protein [Nemania sp. FL0916]
MSSPRKGSVDKDVVAASDLADTVSSLSWSPVAEDLLAASCWDGKVYVYRTAAAGNTQQVSGLTVGEPVLACDWTKDGNMIVAGSTDHRIHALDLSSGQQAIIGSHTAPVRGVRSVEVPGANFPVVASGSWDKTVKFWDLRQSNAAAAMTLDCKDRVYAFDAKAELLVAATAELHVHLVDLKNPNQFMDTQKSPCLYQTKAVACFPDGSGWGTASIGGHCGMSIIDKENKNHNFTFKCHREISRTSRDIWSVNAMAFHPQYTSTFVTAGADGRFIFWDRAARSHLRTYPPAPRNLNTSSEPSSSKSPFTSPSTNKDQTTPPHSAITAVAFNSNGSSLAYAVGYDWSFGCAGNSPQIQTRIMMHPVLDIDAKPKQKNSLWTPSR